MRVSNLLAAVLLTTTLLCTALGGTYKGRHVVFIASTGNYPNFGWTGSIGSAQFFGDEVHWLALDSQFDKGGLFAGSGGPILPLGVPNTALPDDLDPLATTDFNFRNAADSDVTVFAVTTTSGQLAYIARDASGALSTRFNAGAQPLPQSGDLPFTRLGEPHAVGGKLAFLGFHQEGEETTFRGVYVVDEAGGLTVVADSNTELPGGVGSFDLSSSQVGFDGDTVAFWGIHGSRETGDRREGIFKSSADGSGLEAVMVDGDAIPGSNQSADAFQSPPHVVGDTVYLVAFTPSFDSYLLRSRNGRLETLAKPGDTVNGGTIAQVAAAGFDVSGDTVFFNATLNGNSVILSKSGDGPLEVAIDGTVIPGRNQQFRVLDVEGDRLIIGERQSLWATIDTPAKPIVVEGLEGGVIEPGASVTLTVEAIGAGELHYQWLLNNRTIEGASGTSYTIDTVTHETAGFYRVNITNENGRAWSDATIDINAPPAFVGTPPDPITVLAGFPIRFEIRHAGKFPLSYAWHRNGQLLEGQTTKWLFIREALPEHSGEYVLTVTNGLGEAMSHPVSVTVEPAPPNPSFGGQRFETRLAFPYDLNGLMMDGFNQTFAHPEGVAANFYDPTGAYLGVVLLPREGDLRLLVSLEDVNALTGALYTHLTLTYGDRDGRLLLHARDDFSTQFGVFVRETDGSLTTLATSESAVPGVPDAQFTSLYGVAIDGDRRLILGRHGQDLQSLYVVDGDGFRVMLPFDTALPLPDLPFSRVQVYLYENESLYFASSSQDSQSHGLFRYDSDGTLTTLLATGDPLGDDGTTVTTFGSLKRFRNALYLSDATHGLIQLGDRSATLAIGPNAPVEGGGTMINVSRIAGEIGETALFEQLYRDPLGGVRTGLIAWDGITLRLALSPTHIDGLRAREFVRYKGMASDGTLWAEATFSTGQARVLLANTGEVVEDPGNGGGDPGNGNGGGDGGGGENPGGVDTPPILTYERLGAGALRFNVPQGWTLEQSPNLLPPWTPLASQDEVNVPISEPSLYLRLRKED